MDVAVVAMGCEKLGFNAIHGDNHGFMNPKPPQKNTQTDKIKHDGVTKNEPGIKSS